MTNFVNTKKLLFPWISKLEKWSIKFLMELILGFSKVLFHNLKENIQKSIRFNSIQKKKGFTFNKFWTELVVKNITLLNKIYRKDKSSMHFILMNKLNYLLRKETFNVFIVKVDSLKLMLLFILIIEAALKKINNHKI